MGLKMIRMNDRQKQQDDEFSIPICWKNIVETFQSECIRPMLFKLSGNIKGKEVLDIGCGDGVLLNECFRRGAKVTGVDFSKKVLSYSKLFVPKAELYLRDLTKPLRINKKFDIIFCTEVIEHLPIESVDVCLESIHDLLKDDGMFILTVPTINLKIPKKHYQHFTEKKLRLILNKYFKIKFISGLKLSKETTTTKITKKIFDNNIFQIKPIKKYIDKKCYYPIPSKANNIIVKCTKK